jgi:quinol monooxygenase YgiN
MTIHVVVDIDVVPGQLDHALVAFDTLVSATLGEEGCLRFEVYVSEAEDNRIVLVETWSDQHAIDLHMKADYTEDFLGQVEAAFVSPPRARRIRAVRP